MENYKKKLRFLTVDVPRQINRFHSIAAQVARRQIATNVSLKFYCNYYWTNIWLEELLNQFFSFNPTTCHPSNNAMKRVDSAKQWIEQIFPQKNPLSPARPNILKILLRRCVNTDPSSSHRNPAGKWEKLFPVSLRLCVSSFPTKQISFSHFAPPPPRLVDAPGDYESPFQGACATISIAISLFCGDDDSKIKISYKVGE